MAEPVAVPSDGDHKLFIRTKFIYSHTPTFILLSLETLTPQTPSSLHPGLSDSPTGKHPSRK